MNKSGVLDSVKIQIFPLTALLSPNEEQGIIWLNLLCLLRTEQFTRESIKYSMWPSMYFYSRQILKYLSILLYSVHMLFFVFVTFRIRTTRRQVRSSCGVKEWDFCTYIFTSCDSDLTQIKKKEALDNLQYGMETDQRSRGKAKPQNNKILRIPIPIEQTQTDNKLQYGKMGTKSEN